MITTRLEEWFEQPESEAELSQEELERHLSVVRKHLQERTDQLREAYNRVQDAEAQAEHWQEIAANGGRQLQEAYAELHEARVLIRSVFDSVPPFPTFGMGGGTLSEANAQDAWKAKYGDLKFLQPMHEFLTRGTMRRAG